MIKFNNISYKRQIFHIINTKTKESCEILYVIRKVWKRFCKETCDIKNLIYKKKIFTGQWIFAPQKIIITQC